MAGTIELIPLVCIRCSTPIPAQVEEVAWVCTQCGQAQRLDDKVGLLPLAIQFAAGLKPGGTGRPHWVVDGQVNLMREKYSGNQDREAGSFWVSPRCFVIPAFNCQPDELFAAGSEFLLHPPSLVPGQPVPFEPVVLPQEDLQPAVDFIIMSMEAARKDKLRELRFTVSFTSEPVLWILP